MPTAEINPNISVACLQQNYISPSSNHPSKVILAVRWFSPDWLKAPSSFHIAALPPSVVQSLSCVWLFVIPRTAAHQPSLPVTISLRLLKRMSIESFMPSNHLILCCPLLLLPSIFPSIRVFSNELDLHIGWPKYWSFSFRISSSSEYSGLISLMFRGLSKIFSSTTVWKHQFFGAQPSLWSTSHIRTWLLEKP